MARLSCLVIFFFKEKASCFSPRRQVAYEMFTGVKRSEDACRKNYISSSVWPKSFIQTGKYSFFSQRIVYHSFYGLSLTFSSYSSGKSFVFRHASASCMLTKCLLCEAFRKYLSKKWYLQFCLAQIFRSSGKIIFLWHKNCFSKFLCGTRSRFII